MPVSGWSEERFREHFADARLPREIDRPLIVEALVAIEINRR